MLSAAAAAAAGEDGDTIVRGRVTTIAFCEGAANYRAASLYTARREHNERRNPARTACWLHWSSDWWFWPPSWLDDVGAAAVISQSVLSLVRPGGRSVRERRDKMTAGRTNDALAAPARATSSRANFLIELSTTTSVDGVGVDWSAGIAVGATASAKRSEASSGRWQASADRDHCDQLTPSAVRRSVRDVTDSMKIVSERVDCVYNFCSHSVSRICYAPAALSSFWHAVTLSLHCTSYIHLSILSQIDLPDRW